MEKHFVSEGEQFAVFVKHGRIVVRLATVFVDRDDAEDHPDSRARFPYPLPVTDTVPNKASFVQKVAGGYPIMDISGKRSDRNARFLPSR